MSHPTRPGIYASEVPGEAFESNQNEWWNTGTGLTSKIPFETSKNPFHPTKKKYNPFLTTERTYDPGTSNIPTPSTTAISAQVRPRTPPVHTNWDSVARHRLDAYTKAAVFIKDAMYEGAPPLGPVSSAFKSGVSDNNNSNNYKTPPFSSSPVPRWQQLSPYDNSGPRTSWSPEGQPSRGHNDSAQQVQYPQHQETPRWEPDQQIEHSPARGVSYDERPGRRNAAQEDQYPPPRALDTSRWDLPIYQQHQESHSKDRYPGQGTASRDEPLNVSPPPPPSFPVQEQHQPQYPLPPITPRAPQGVNNNSRFWSPGPASPALIKLDTGSSRGSATASAAKRPKAKYAGSSSSSSTTSSSLSSSSSSRSSTIVGPARTHSTSQIQRERAAGIAPGSLSNQPPLSFMSFPAVPVSGQRPHQRSPSDAQSSGRRSSRSTSKGDQNRTREETWASGGRPLPWSPAFRGGPDVGRFVEEHRTSGKRMTLKETRELEMLEEEFEYHGLQ